MFRPVEMCKINVLVLNKHLTEMTLRLGDKALLHPVDAVNQSESHLLNNLDDEREQQLLLEQLERCDFLIKKLGIDDDAEVPRTKDMSKDDIAALLDKIGYLYKEQDKAITEIVNDSAKLAQEDSALAGYPLQTVSLDVLHSMSHFYMVTGRLAPSLVSTAVNMIGDRGVILPAEGKEGNVLVLSSRKNHWAVEEELGKIGFSAVEEPEGIEGSVSEHREQLVNKLVELKTKLEEGRMNFMKLAENYGGVLLGMRTQLRGLLAVLKARKHFGQVKQLACISGWVPKDSVDDIRKLVDEVTGGTGIIQVIDADDDEFVKAGLETVPVKFRSGSLTRPFQMLITNFGVPTYHEIDPTLFVAITFVLLFGFMFGDVGQGLVLLLAGLFLKFSKRKLAESLRDSGTLLAFCGGSAMLFGLAYGSVFGYEELIHHLWVNPLSKVETDLYMLLGTAVGVGIVFSSVAIIINIVNHFHAKKYYEGTFDRYGICGLVFYWGCLAFGLFTFVFPEYAKYMMVLIVVPLVLMFIKEPLHNILNKHGVFHKTNALSVVLEGVIELMETFTGYLSGTVSFVRVGAFAISHAALCLAVFSIVHMLKDVPGGTIVQILVIIGGNILVICFEGMVAMIQGVRLEYYELFGKYFEGGGLAFKPFDLKESSKGDSPEA